MWLLYKSYKYHADIVLDWSIWYSESVYYREVFTGKPDIF